MITHMKGMNKQWKGAFRLKDSKMLGTTLDTDHHCGVAHLLENRIRSDGAKPSTGTVGLSHMTKFETELIRGQTTLEMHFLGRLLGKLINFGEKSLFFSTLSYQSYCRI